MGGIRSLFRARRNAVVAAARLIRPAQVKAVPAVRDWQTAAWSMYDCVGEYRQAINWRASVASRCLLFIGKVDRNGDADPVPLDPATDNMAVVRPLEDLFNGNHAAMIFRIIQQLGVPGETFVIGADIEDPNAPPVALPGPARRVWMVCSNEEIVRTGRSVKIRPPDSDQLVPIPVDQSMMLRIWEPHARRAWEADSASRAALPVLEEIVAIGQRGRAELRSRLKGAGIMELAEGATLPEPEVGEDEEPPDDPDSYALMQAMVTPIQNPDDASAVTPIIARVPDEVAGKAIKLHDWAVKIDERLDPMLERALQRLGIILDCSPERLTTGLSGANHWSGAMITEDEVKTYIAPPMGLLCEALTSGYYRPVLAEMQLPGVDPDDYAIWFNTAALTVRPNRAPDAQALNAAGKLSDAAARREAGFSDEDAMDDKERTQWLVERLALAGIDPALVAPYLRVLGIDAQLPVQAVAVPAAPAPVALPGQVPPAAISSRPNIPGVPDTPGNPSNPAQIGATASKVADARWWLATVELCVLRALEVAGNRLRSRTPRPQHPPEDTPAYALHSILPSRADNDPDRILDGAFGLARTVLAEQPQVLNVIEQYVRFLLATREPHQRGWLIDALVRGGCVSHGEADDDA